MKKAVQRLKVSMIGAALASSLVAMGGVIVVGTAIAATRTMVATSSVNLRSGPGMSYPVIGMVPGGAKVTATATSGSWIAVTYNGKQGYVFRSYLASTSTNAEPLAAVSTTASKATGSATTANEVNVRSGPSLTATVITTLPAGTVVKTTGVTSGDWTQVVHDGANRWMYTALLRRGGTATASTGSSGTSGSTASAGKVRTTDVLFVRSDGNLNGTVLGKLPANSIVDTTGATTAEYTQILFQGQKAWIASRFTTAALSAPAVPLTSIVSTGSLTSAQAKLVAFAKAQVGDAYVWGAEGPNAFDCSGLTLAAYKQVGISLPHQSAVQSTLGKTVSRANMQPGDLIFWFSPVHHVSIYIGNGMMVHARNTKVGVVVQSVDSYTGSGEGPTVIKRLLP